MFYLPIILYRVQRAALDARRRDRTWRYLAWSTAAGAITATLIATVAAVAALLVAIGLWWLALALVVLIGVPLAQPLLVRHVIAPLGWYRVAFWVGHFGTTRDSDADALACAAWAYVKRPSGDADAWITARLGRRRPLGDAEVIATALLAAGRGDAATARQLMRSALDLVEHHAVVRELAGEWLACDAAERGAWDELAESASRASWPATPLTYFLEGIAACKTRGAHGSVPSAIDLYARWLLAPHRRVTLALLRDRDAIVQAAAPTTAAEAAADGDAPALPDAALPRAVAAHLALTARVDPARFADAVAAWDAALAASPVHEWLGRRAIELDAPLGAADRALRDVASAVAAELSRCADEHALGAPASRGRIGEPLAHKLRHGRLDALEAGFSRWADRRHDGVLRAPIDEWREVLALRSAYDAAVAAGGQSLRRLAFPHAYKTCNAMAVWLWNTHREYALSHAISVWLLGEALAVGDTEAIDLCTRNTRLAVPTRNGNVYPKDESSN